MYVKVKIITGSRREVVTKIQEDLYDVSLKEKPLNNNANRRLLEIMHEIFKKSSIRIISGHHSPSKILSIETR